MSQTRQHRDTRYVVVVHGIGEQRKNETVLPVINRFAEARRTDTFAPKPRNPLSLGVLSTYLEFAEWIELDGIPCAAPEDGCKLPPFIGRRLERPCGENLRFVDIHWADVMKEQFDVVGEDLDPWTNSLIERLTSREAPSWILQLLRSMRKGLIPLRRVLGLRLPGLSDKVFNRFLGDAQLYGEFGPTRGRGIRLFHESLARIQSDHDEGEAGAGQGRPRFTIIAHSLGSVLAFDALLYAHGARAGDTGSLDLGKNVLAGYSFSGESAEDRPALHWIENVDSFVTLGSPIDKYLVLWWLSYQHLCDTDWMDPGLLEKRKTTRIRHYNYCDEQDPVGHELDVAYTAPAVRAVFSKEEERIFTRYSAPGVAHVKYWQDGALFARILDLAIDGRPVGDKPAPLFERFKWKPKEEQDEDRAEQQAQRQEPVPEPVAVSKPEPEPEPEPYAASLRPARPVNWFRWKTYFGALLWAYLGIPVAGWAVATFTMIWALNPEVSWSMRAPLLAVSLGTILVTMWLMTLMVAWRILLRSKRKKKAGGLPPGEWAQRTVATWTVRGVIIVLPFVWAHGLFASIYAAWPEWKPIFPSVERLGSLLHALPSRLKQIQILGWKPEALQEIEPEGFYAGLIAAFAMALILGLWNLAVFLTMKIRWGRASKSLELDFVDYQKSDPARPAAAIGTGSTPAA